MKEDLIEYERSIKLAHRFGWTPKFEEQFHTQLKGNIFIHLAVKVFEELDWDVVYRAEDSVEAKRKGAWDNWTEKITVKFEYGKVGVKSESLGGEYWDRGNNSKRVKLFIYAFQEFEKEHDRKALKELEAEIKKEDNWDDYEIPEKLPLPEIRPPSQIWIPIFGGIITAIGLGFLIALLSVKANYIIFFYEIAAGFLLGLCFKFLIRLGNYNQFDKLNYILIGTIILTYLFNQFFQYMLIAGESEVYNIGFWEFMKVRFSIGMFIESVNLGSVGLVIAWILQLGLTWLVAFIRLTLSVNSHQLEKVPSEVTVFAIYHLHKGKTEEQVRAELAKMGWDQTEDQDDVFESMLAIQDLMELRR